MRRVVAVALVVMALTAGPAAAAEPFAETNVVERVECMFRVYVNEGGENGLDCLV